MHQTEYQYSNRKQKQPTKQHQILGHTSVENLPTRSGRSPTFIIRLI